MTKVLTPGLSRAAKRRRNGDLAAARRRVGDSAFGPRQSVSQRRLPTLPDEEHAALLNERRRPLRRQRCLRGLLRHAQARARSSHEVRDARHRQGRSVRLH